MDHGVHFGENRRTTVACNCCRGHRTNVKSHPTVRGTVTLQSVRPEPAKRARSATIVNVVETPQYTPVHGTGVRSDAIVHAEQAPVCTPTHQNAIRSDAATCGREARVVFTCQVALQTDAGMRTDPKSHPCTTPSHAALSLLYTTPSPVPSPCTYTIGPLRLFVIMPS